MLSKNQVVTGAFTAAVNRLFKDVCTVYVVEKSTGEDGGTVFSKRVLFENIPCRISFDSIGHAKTNGGMERTRFTRKNLIPADEISSEVRLFVEPQFDIPEGSEVYVLHGGEPLKFRAAGYAAAYLSHREIVVVPVEKFV